VPVELERVYGKDIGVEIGLMITLFDYRYECGYGYGYEN
jgi:hypothetical protein